MAGYLDSYGVAETRREGVIKKIVITLAIAIVAGLSVYFFFRTFFEERAAHKFLDAVRAGNSQQAYQIWGCTSPCKDYPLNKFMEDWGPKGIYSSKIAQAKYTTVDVCGEGVILTLEMPGSEPLGIWVDRKSKALSYAPWPRCPGRHLHLWEFIKSRFA